MSLICETWGFPEIGGPLNHPFLDRIFLHKPSIFWVPLFQETPIFILMNWQACGLTTLQTWGCMMKHITGELMLRQKLGILQGWGRIILICRALIHTYIHIYIVMYVYIYIYTHTLYIVGSRHFATWKCPNSSKNLEEYKAIKPLMNGVTRVTRIFGIHSNRRPLHHWIIFIIRIADRSLSIWIWPWVIYHWYDMIYYIYICKIIDLDRTDDSMMIRWSQSRSETAWTSASFSLPLGCTLEGSASAGSFPVAVSLPLNHGIPSAPFEFHLGISEWLGVALNSWFRMENWLVVWLPFLYILPFSWEFLIIPIDFHIFQRGGQITNQKISI